jgi:IMP cyclohydrolase
MYVGRIVAVGRTAGRSWAGYRVSSRSFPNRMAEIRGSSVLVAPRDPADLAKNPYIAYNCIRTFGDTAVVANGTQADTIVERAEDGMKPLDALALCLVTLGYERDELNTPRLAGVVRGKEAWLGVARDDEFRAKRYILEDGDAFMVATYEANNLQKVDLSGSTAQAVAKGAFDLPFEMPVCSAAALWSGDKFELGVYNP